jgi:hypothetical protein
VIVSRPAPDEGGKEDEAEGPKEEEEAGSICRLLAFED